MNVITSKMDKRILAASLLSIGLASIPSQGILASETLMNGVQVQQQQTIKVSGVVSDSEGPIIGASVVEKDAKSNGTVTDLDGKFQLTVKPGTTLVISYMGYKKVEVKAVAGKPLNVTMQQDSETLNEVVVVGFGTQKKVNLTGAVDVVDSKQLSERPVANAVQALQGAAPGLEITQSSGSVESRPSINVRGATTIGATSGGPLILIDGMEGDLNAINPQDIESISVLKDAAASSIYGSRAPFGVILVTTKSGKDAKTTINYNNNLRIATPLKRPNMMNSVQFAAWMNDTFVNDGQNPYFQTNAEGTGRFDQILEYHNATPVGNGVRQTADGKLVYEAPDNMYNSLGQPSGGFSRGVGDNNWYDMLYKNSSFSQQHNLSASGGNAKFNYYLSGSFYDQNGMLKLGKEDLKRYTATAKINSQITPWLNLRYSMRFTREDQERPTFFDWNFLGNFGCKQWPVLPAYDQNGNHFYSDDTSIWALEDLGSTNKQYDNLYHQLGLTFEPIKDWKTHVDFNYRINSTTYHSHNYPLYNYDRDNNPFYRRSYTDVHEDYYKTNYYNFNVRTEYSLSLQKKHNFHVMAGMQVEDLKQLLFGLTRQGIIINGKPQIDMTTGVQDGEQVTPGTNGQRNEWATVGVFGRFNYDYMSRYLLEVNVRGDGSSRFRKGHQWKVFPSFSLGWNLAEEKFMERSHSWLDMLKLRFSYGSLGNQNTNNWYYTYQTMGVYPLGGDWLQNGVKVPTAGTPGLVSESLTWERVETYNYGVDWAMLNNRLTGSFNLYVRNTLDMVGPAPELPSILGTGVPQTNNTDLQTRGWELTLGWNDRLSNGLRYSAKFSLYDNHAKVTRYPNNPTNSINKYIPGQRLGDIWGYETIGIAKTKEEMEAHLATLPNGGQDSLGSKWSAGDIMYKDLNGDGKISSGAYTKDDHGDLKVIGNDTPRYQFGLDLSGDWKGFDLRMFFQGVMKRDVWQGSSYMFGTPGGQWGCAGIEEADDYFRDENTWSVKQGVKDVNLDAYLPRALYSGKNLNIQTKYLQNAAYIRLKNLTLGYTLPVNLTSKWGISKARVYFSGENLWTGTSLAKQFDPETVYTSGGNGYSLSRTYSFGLSVTF